MRKIPEPLFSLSIAGATLIFMALVLTGCASSFNEMNESGVTAVDVRLSDNRLVTCIQAGGYGITCDWANAK